MTQPTVTASPAKVVLELEADARLHYALQQSGVGVVKRLTVRNEGAVDLASIEVLAQLGAAQPHAWRGQIEVLRAGEAHNFADVDLGLDIAALRQQDQRLRTALRVTARSGETALATIERPIDLFPLGEWPGLESLPELLAAFVQPDDPSIADLLARALVHLRAASDATNAWPPAFNGYQTRDPQHVLAMAEALHLALRDLGIRAPDAPGSPPASPPADGGRVSFPAEIARARRANGLDLALFYAAALEQAGLHALVVLADQHAFAGCWLSDDTFQEAAGEDGLRLRKRVDLDEICVVDPTLATVQGAADFAHARTAARQRLTDLDGFRTVIDVARARRFGFAPLPAPSLPGPAAAPGATVVEPNDAAAPTPSPQTPGPTPSTLPPETPATRLDRWRRKLLDLSLRNRLINFKATKLALRLAHEDLSGLEDALASGADFVLRPAPEHDATRRPRQPGEPTDESARRATFFASELGQRRICTTLQKDELDARLLDLWRHAKVAREESGANVVFLALGSLRWFEAPGSKEARQAPILLLPLDIERISAREGFRVRLGENDARVNVTLLEKLTLEFQLDVTGLDELLEDDNGLDVRAVLQRFRRAVRDIDRWDVVDDAWIAPFSFSKFLMWRDLQEQKDALLQSPVLRHLVERPGQPFAPEATFPDAAQLDITQLPQDTFLPLDADSSQLAAVIAAASGRSFVLEGPPGTGKSQTIANLIAQCLAQGKRVLFVAEKMAALEVVHKRLDKVGLGPFCLELHSKESRKRAVLDSMQKALDVVAAREPQDWQKAAEQLSETRGVLNAYVRAMHAPRPSGESVFQVTSALIGLQKAVRVPLAIAHVEQIDPAWTQTRREVVDVLRAAATDLGALPTHPLRAVQRSRWETTLPDRAAKALATAQAKASALAQACAGAHEVLGVDARRLTQQAFAALEALVGQLLATPGAADALLTEPGFDDLRAQLLATVEAVRQKDLLRERVRETFADSALSLDLEDLRQRLRGGLGSFWPMSWLRCRGVRKELLPQAKGRHLGSDQDLAHRLDDAIDLRARIAALAAPDHAGARFFGIRLWNAGDPGAAGVSLLAHAIEWAGNMRAALRTLHDALGDQQGAALRQRVVSLAGVERDALAAGARHGDRLRAFVAATEAFAGARQGVHELLELECAGAFTPPDAAAPWLAHADAALRSLTGALGDLNPWFHWRRVRAQALQHELTPLVQALETGTLEPSALAPAFERAFREAWLAAVIDADPVLREFAGREHERRIQRFGELDQRSLELASDLLRARLAARVPRGVGEPAASSEVGILLRELAKKTRHKPLRRLFVEIPNLLPRLKPCFLMSPLSVAQYLTAGQELFDVVVFDEASQITVSDAVGALARGRSGVVVGDSKQLPPTTFFQRLEEGEEDLDDIALEELESILDECRSAGFRALRLRWHYRSRHESLIAFSNWHYYDNALLTFPAAQDKVAHLGVSVVRVEGGVYDRSKTRTNRKEAESVVRDLLARLRAPSPHGGSNEPSQKASVGIVTFSQAQQTLVETLLDEERRKDPGLEPYFGDAVAEPVFVKNLENVQGDERDVILFSICYGPDVHGKVAMAFGPLNNAGGERRLNVAITRARQQVVVHATLRPDQIDLARTNALGVKHLRSFLDYATRGPQALAEALTLDPHARAGSPFEADVRQALVERGHDVALQVGCSGYRVDLAVRDPQRPGCFLLGIECDGAFYHAATTARDRDRLRQTVLERLGWRLVRVWSSDWWRGREREVLRLEQKLTEAQNVAASATSNPPARLDQCAVSEPAIAAPKRDSAAANCDMTALAGSQVYAPTRVDRARGAFETATAAALVEVILLVLATEAPLHGDLLVRRVGSFLEMPRVTARARKRVLDAARALPAPHQPVERGEFLWLVGLDPSRWTDFRVPDPTDDLTSRDAEHLPPEEIANAALQIVQGQIGLSQEDLVRHTAQVFGFARAGTKVQAAMAAGIELAVARGGIAARDGRLTVTP